MAIQQHPIPQNVTQFQFKLVGDMTLKQFLELAGGIVVAVIIYAFPLPVFFKWPLMAVAAGLGAGMAFVPVEGRPLDQWLIAFVRSIYQPTIYVWKKSSGSEEIPTKTSPTNPPLQITTATLRPTVAVSTESVINQDAVTSSPVSPINKLTNEQINPTLPKPQPTTVYMADTNPSLHIEKQAPITASHTEVKTEQAVTPVSVPSPQINRLTDQQVNAVAPKPQLLPIPHPPQTPNTIVGMTLTPGGSILDSAIVEITLNHATVRATKSNKLGQFLFAKPLDNGLYQITAERQGYTFPIYSLNLTGAVVQPIALKATSETNL